MAAITHVTTLSRVAEILGEDEDWLAEITIELEPEDGRLLVLGTDDLLTTAFTRDGVENLRAPVEEYKQQKSAAAVTPNRE